jgi:hypothetical protein
MGRTDVRHEAFEVLLDSRAYPEWVADAPVAEATVAGTLDGVM